jgi:glutaredoxin
MHITVFTKPDCGYCDAFKTLARAADLQFEEKTLDVHFTREQLKQKYPSATTYPVVVVDGFYIGGYTEFRGLVEQKTAESKHLLNEGF